MEFQDSLLRVDSFLAVTLGIIVLFVGKRLNEKIGFLREFSIPEPVTGGLLFSILFGLLYLASGLEVEFELRARDILLVYFFTTIGINASARDLLAGGRPLVILLAITITFMVAQNLTGISVATLFDLPAAVGVIGGTVSLIGGHGTTIAWAPNIAETYRHPERHGDRHRQRHLRADPGQPHGRSDRKFLIKRHQLTPRRSQPLMRSRRFRTLACRKAKEGGHRPSRLSGRGAGDSCLHRGRLHLERGHRRPGAQTCRCS
jgi:ESS family glutamate:Na+ symporter